MIVLFILASVVSSNFLSSSKLINVLRLITDVDILACGMSFVLISGNINIAYDGLIALLGCMACIIMTKTGNLLLAVIVPVAMGMVIGYLFGICVTTFKVPAFIVGLAFTSMASGSVMLITNGVMISSSGLGNFSVLGQGYIGIVPICVIIMVAVIIISHVILSRSCFGRQVYAVGGNRAAAITYGVDADKVIRRVYVIDGIFLAIGSVVYMSRMNHGEPTGGDGYAFDALTAACVGGVSISGGTGNIVGAFFGAAIVGILNNLLNLMNVNANWQDVVSGIVIVAAVTIDMYVQYSTYKNATANMKKATA